MEVTEQISQNDIQPESPQQEEAPAPRPRRLTLAVIAFVVTVAAWIFLPVYYPAALGGGIAALVLSVLALRQPRGASRNLALVSLVASAVVLLVLAVFWSAIYYVSTQI